MTYQSVSIERLLTVRANPLQSLGYYLPDPLTHDQPEKNLRHRDPPPGQSRGGGPKSRAPLPTVGVGPWLMGKIGRLGALTIQWRLSGSGVAR